MDQYFLLIKTILFPLVGGILVLYYISVRYKKDTQIIRDGEKVEGIIFDFLEESGWSNSSDNIHLKDPIIRFVTKKGEWITEKYHVSNSSLRKGDKVQVTYNPANPREFFVHLNHTDTVLYAVFIVAGVAGILFGLYKLVEYLVS